MRRKLSWFVALVLLLGMFGVAYGQRDPISPGAMGPEGRGPDGFPYPFSLDSQRVQGIAPSSSGDSWNVDLIGRALYGPAQSTFVEGDYAYVGTGGALLILDITAPSNPTLVGSIYTPGLAYGVYVLGSSYAYVADGWAGLRVLDVSDPTYPFEAGFYDTGGAAYGVYVLGDYAYVADEYTGLQ